MNSLIIEGLIILAPGVLSCLILSRLNRKTYSFWQFAACALAFDLMIHVFTLAILLLMGFSGETLIGEMLSTVLVTLTYGIISLGAAFLFPFVAALFTNIKIGKSQ